MENIVNQIVLRGCLNGLPEYSHSNHGQNFFRFTLHVARLSGAIDQLPIVIREDILCGFDLSSGSMIRIEGQIRSHNTRSDGVRRLLIFVYAQSICADEGEPINEVTLTGPLCRTPVYRRTPLGRDICDIMLAVPRGYARADYLPCILWGRTAYEIARCDVGDNVNISGRLQSRVYTKQTESGSYERTAYEISAMTAQIVDQR